MATSVINGTGNSWQLPSRGISIIGSMKVYNTYEDLQRDTQKSAFAWVDDASGDPTVNTGGALYRIKDGTLVKMLETEGMDQIFGSEVPWEKILNKPASSVEAIDEAVNARHNHENKEVLDLLTNDESGLKVGEDIVITDKNIKDFVTGSGGSGTDHSHNNMELLESIKENEDGSVSIGNSKVVTEATLEDLKITNVVKNIGRIPEGTTEVSFDLDHGNYFIVEGSSDYIVPNFTGTVTNVSGTIVFRGGTSVLWPKGRDANGFFWVWGTEPQDISNNPDTDIIVLDYRVVDNAIFINEVCSKIGEV